MSVTRMTTDVSRTMIKIVPIKCQGSVASELVTV